MLNMTIPEKEVKTLYDAVVTYDQDFDICDDDWDWGIAFSCEKAWEDCSDYYDCCMLLFALNIEFTKFSDGWYCPCKVWQFVWANKDAFEKFFNEENRRGYRPKDYKNIDPEKDSGFFEAYMEPLESLIVGNYSESDYKKLFDLLTEGQDLTGVTLPEYKGDDEDDD